jgi:hypothetical protein
VTAKTCFSCGGNVPRTRSISCRDCVPDRAPHLWETLPFVLPKRDVELVKYDGTIGPDPRYGQSNIGSSGGSGGRRVGRVLGHVARPHEFRATKQWREQHEVVVGTSSSPPDRVRPQTGQELAEVAAQLAGRLRSGRTMRELLDVTARRGKPTESVRRARVDLGWITTELLAKGTTLRSLATLMGRWPSTIKKLADDFRALDKEATRFVVLPLTQDAQTYVDRVLAKRKEKRMTLEQRVEQLEGALAEIGQLGIRLAQLFPQNREVLRTVDDLIAALAVESAA